MSDQPRVLRSPAKAEGLDGLRRLQRHHRALLSSQDGFWERDLVTEESWYSPSFWSLLGFTPGELPNDRAVVNARIHPDDVVGFLAAYQRSIDALGSFAYEMRILDRAGEWRWVRGRGRTWPGADGRPAIIAGALTDVHQEKLARIALETLTQRFERAIAASDEALFERVAGSNDLYVSERFFDLVNEPRKPMPVNNRAMMGRVHPDDMTLFDRAREDGQVVGDTGPRWDITFRYRCIDERYRWLRMRGRAYRRDDGAVLITGVVGDVHELVLARQEIERTRRLLEELVRERTASLEHALTHAEAQRQEAERANRAKSRFLAHMSHEIRTPLNGVLGLNELALRLATVPAQQRYIESALRSGQALRQVIDDVLDLSRVEAGGLQIKHGAFDLAEMLAETLRTIMPLVRHKGLWVRFDWTGGEPWVLGDAERIRQIVTNLVGNAAKFTEHGHIALIAQIVTTDAPRCYAEIRVVDTGPGLDDALQARVFEAFVQADETLSRRHGGTGLGLTIARGLAQAMSGELEVEQSSPEGSTFLLTLPLTSTPDPDPPPAAEPGLLWLIAQAEGRGHWLARRLERLGWRAQIVTGVETAIASARAAPAAERPAVVVISEAVLDAPADLATLRALLPHASITLLIRPDWHDATIETLAAEQHVTISVSPFTPRDLLRLAGAAVHVDPAARADESGSDTPISHVLLVEDNAVNRLIGEEFLRAIGLEVRSAEDGQEAIAQCMESAPSLVLMDLQMPVMDGLEATRRLRGLQREGVLPAFPIVALTAHATPEDRESVTAAGADGYLTKPILLDQLREELAQWLPIPAVAR